MKKMLITSSAYEQYKRTVAKHPPETGGVLIGTLDDPYTVREFRFCPPSRNRDGGYIQSSTRFGVDAEYINWVIDNECTPNGLYVIGFLHSHPAGCTQLSGGDMNGLAGDIPFLNACLEAPEMRQAGLQQLLAPITTFKSDSSDQIHGWVLHRGASQPEALEVEIEQTTDLPKAHAITDMKTRATETADLIDTFILRQQHMLNRRDIGFWDRRQVRRLYQKAFNESLQNPPPLVRKNIEQIERKSNVKTYR